MKQKRRISRDLMGSQACVRDPGFKPDFKELDGISASMFDNTDFQSRYNPSYD